MPQVDPLKGLNCQKLAQEAATDNHVTHPTCVRPTKSRTVYRGGIAYLCLGIIGLGYSLLLFEFPPVWNYAYVEIFHAVIYCFSGMLLVVSSSNFDKRKYIIACLWLGSITVIMCGLGSVVGAIGAGRSQTQCVCKTEIHGTSLSDIVTERSCKTCGTTAHLLVYLAITIHCCVQFGVALWVTIHSGRALRHSNNWYTQPFREP